MRNRLLFWVNVGLLNLSLAATGVAHAAEHVRNYLSDDALKTALSSKNAEVRSDAIEWNDFKRWQTMSLPLLQDPNPKIRSYMVWRLSEPYFDSNRLQLIEALAKDKDENVRADVARFSLTPDRIVTQLVSENNWTINEHAASNMRASKQVLEKIANQVPKLKNGLRSSHEDDRINDTISNLIKNQNTDPETLRRLYQKGIPHFHLANAWHDSANWPADLVVQFALEYSFDTSDTPVEKKFWQKIKKDQASLPPPQVLAEMLQGPIYYLRSAAVSSRFTPPEALAQYYQTLHVHKDDSLEELGRNPSLGIEIKKHMLKTLKTPKLDTAIYGMMKQASMEPELLEDIVKRYQNVKRDTGLYLYVEQAAGLLRMQKIYAAMK